MQILDIFFWPKDRNVSNIIKVKLVQRLTCVSCFCWSCFMVLKKSTTLWVGKILFWTLKKVHPPPQKKMPLAAIQLALCVFHSKTGQRVRWPQSSHRCAFTQRHVPFIDWSSTQHTSVHTPVCVHTHLRREQIGREREPRHTRHSSYVRFVCGYSLVQS